MFIYKIKNFWVEWALEMEIMISSMIFSRGNLRVICMPMIQVAGHLWYCTVEAGFLCFAKEGSVCRLMAWFFSILTFVRNKLRHNRSQKLCGHCVGNLWHSQPAARTFHQGLQQPCLWEEMVESGALWERIKISLSLKTKLSLYFIL